MDKNRMFITTLISVFTLASILLFWGTNYSNAADPNMFSRHAERNIQQSSGQAAKEKHKAFVKEYNAQQLRNQNAATEGHNAQGRENNAQQLRNQNAAIESYNAQIREYNEQVIQQNEKAAKRARIQQRTEDVNRKRAAEEAYYNRNKPVSRDSGVKPYLYDNDGSYPEMMYR